MILLLLPLLATQAAAADLGVEWSYTHMIDAAIPATFTPGLTMDYRSELVVHWRTGPILYQVGPYAIGSGQSPDEAGLRAAFGGRVGPLTISVGHESRHNLDRASPWFDGRHPVYNLNWIRIEAEMGAGRDWRLW